MKKAFAILLLVFHAVAGMAQGSASHKLTLSDFAIRDTSESDRSYTHIRWDYSREKRSDGNTLYIYNECRPVFDKELSWIRSDQDFKRELELNQTILEMARSYARSATDSLVFAPLTVKRYNMKLSSEFMVASRAFRETGIPSFPSPLEPEFDITKVPWALTGRGWRASLSLGETVFLGPTPELCPPTTEVQAGLEYFWHRSSLLAEASFGGGVYSGRYSLLSGRFFDGKMVPYYNASLRYACHIASLGRNKLSLFSGLGYSSIGLIMPRHSEQKNKINGPSLTEGVMFDLYFPQEKVSFSTHRKLRIRDGLRIKAYTDQLLVLPRRVVVPTINLSVGYLFDLEGVGPRL